MAMARYNPTARAASRTMPSNGRTGTTDPTRGYANQDGPGNTTIDYGTHRGGFTPPSQPTSYVNHATPYFDQQHAGDVARKTELLAGNDAYQQAKAAGDLRGQIAAMTAMRGQMQQQRFVDQGGTPETWNNRFSNENNWPRPTSSIGYSHGPGRPDYATVGTNPSPYGPGNSAPPMQGGVRRGATPQTNAPMSAGVPPMQNPMMQGYQSAYPQGGYMGGGAGVPTGGGWGSAGGRPMTTEAYSSGPGWWNQGNPGASMGGGEMGYMYGNSPMGGGNQDRLMQMLFASQMGGGMPGGGAMNPAMMGRGMYGSAMPGGGNMGMMGGGYNPYAGLGMY